MNDGIIEKNLTDKWEYDTTYGRWANIYHLSGDIYAILYQASDVVRIFTTRAYESNGTLEKIKIDEILLTYRCYTTPRLINVNNSNFVAVYTRNFGSLPDPGYDVYLETIQIDILTGEINDTLKDIEQVTFGMHYLQYNSNGLKN